MSEPTQPDQQQSDSRQQAEVLALLALVDTLDSWRERLTSTVMGIVAQAVHSFRGWYSTEEITGWTGGVVDDVEAVLATLAGAVDAFTATAVGQLTGQHVRPTGSIDVSALRQGITHAGAYGRVADAYRWQQSRLDAAGKAIATDPEPQPPTLISPLEAALNRAADVADMDVQKVVQQQAAKTLQQLADQLNGPSAAPPATPAARTQPVENPVENPPEEPPGEKKGPIIGWRRVIHPEMSRDGTCGLCVAASTRIYHTGDLMPLHENCHCVPVPVVLGHDLAGVINDQALARLYAEAGGNTAALLKKTRYRVDEHGELGPVLNPAGAKQRTPRQVAADTAPRSARPKPTGALRRDLQSLRDSLARSLARVDDELIPLDAAKWEPYRDALAERVDDLEQQLLALAA